MSENPINEVSFIPTLVDRAQELAPLYKEHVKFYKEPVPVVFLASVQRIVADSVKALGDQRSDRVEAILDLIDQALSSPDQVLRELVSVSFVEAIVEAPVREAIRAYGKPALNRELEELR